MKRFQFFSPIIEIYRDYRQIKGKRYSSSKNSREKLGMRPWEIWKP